MSPDAPQNTTPPQRTQAAARLPRPACPCCEDRGTIHCSACQGNGFYWADGVDCRSCQGRGRQPCLACGKGRELSLRSERDPQLTPRQRLQEMGFETVGEVR